MPVPYSLTISSLEQRLRRHELTPTQIAHDVLAAAAEGDRHHAWIYRLPEQAVLAQAERVEDEARSRSLPLYGIPFAIKDNIDAAGYPTTAACPAYSYQAGASAESVQRLMDAGALLIGKTNMDQFACGLVGTRSPYGACTNPFDPSYIAGGSSSGSAVVVTLNLVSFALGTDTAGSGRVPAGFNNIVGLKPTRGIVSTAGVVPACLSLDCVSIFALIAHDAWRVYQICRGYDAGHPYSRYPSPSMHERSGSFRCGVVAKAQRDFCGDAEAERMFAQSLALIELAGGDLVEIDYAPFRAVSELLYGGPWLAERLVAIQEFFAAHQHEMHPTTRAVIADGARYSAVDAFRASYRLRELKRQTAAIMDGIDVMVVPTTPTIYTVDQVLADPFRLNSNLGLYSNFVNLLDLAAIAVPSGMRADGLPAGVTMIAPGFSEPMLCSLGERLHRLSGAALGATDFGLTGICGEYIDAAGDADITLAVVGAHLSGMPLNHELTERGARFFGRTRTAPLYRMHLLSESPLPKPGLVRSEGKGHAIEVELWRMPVGNFGSFVARIPPPLTVGTLILEGGGHVIGFLCERYAIAQARDISQFGGWRKFNDASESIK